MSASAVIESVAVVMPADRPAKRGPVLLQPSVVMPADASHPLFGMLLDEIPQGILVIDAEGIVTYANLAMSVLFPMRSVRQNARLAEQPGMADIIALVAEGLAMQQRVKAEVRVAFQAGRNTVEERVYNAVASPMTDPKMGGAWVMVEDVTDHALTEQIRKDFVTNASHELRTPLSLIHGYIETLKSGMIKSTGSLNRCLEVMEKHSKRMMRIIEDMLTISRLEGGDAQLRTETFLVRGCVEDVLEHLTPLIEARKPRITLNFPAHGGMLEGDRFYWDQIFSNLIENALKENPVPGLHLTISGEWTEDDCTLRVQDNGVGIPAEDVPFVFKRFFRCAKHHSQEIKGTGLGLSIVRRAVEAHGGTVELQSEPGVRTVFLMRVPL
ncbi:MAG: hypothetical protein JWO94_373 [Verrucomicrobiaceae bacterium]|nr:hypothetical protein [Verrucomicrobiaceae bacterium]